jgi:hypothetical protein
MSPTWTVGELSVGAMVVAAMTLRAPAVIVIVPDVMAMEPGVITMVLPPQMSFTDATAVSVMFCAAVVE